MEHLIAWDRTTKDRPTQVIWDLEAKLAKLGATDALRAEITAAGGELIDANLVRSVELYYRVEGVLVTHRPRTIGKAVETYVRARDESGLGASDFGDANIEEGDAFIYRISYNGRLWIPLVRAEQR